MEVRAAKTGLPAEVAMHVIDRRSLILAIGLLLVAGCSSDSALPTSAATRPPVVTTSAAATTSPGPAASTTTAVPPPPFGDGATFLIRNADGVWQVDLDGTVEQLIDGTVRAAVDDTQGGLMYQRGSGRVWEEDDAAWVESESSVVWWIPKGANTAQELIVPNEAAGQRVTLHDAFATNAGFAVLYTRHDPGATVDDLVDRLRRIDVPGSTVTQLYAQGTFEHGFGETRSNGALVAGQRWGQLERGCFLLEMDGSASKRLPEEASGREGRNIGGCRITTDNELAFYLDEDQAPSTTVQIWDLDLGVELHRIDLLNAGDRVGDIEVGPGLLVANRHLESTYVAADVVSLEPGYPTRQLAVPGQARVMRAAIEIASPIRLADEVGAGPAHYRYSEDGAWRVAFGVETKIIDEPVWNLWDDHMGGVIYDAAHDQKYWLPAGATQATRLADLDPTDEFLMQAEQFFTGLVDGTPTIFHAGYAGDVSDCGGEWQLVGRDLESGEAIGYQCLPIGDVDPGIGSIGGDRFVAVPWSYAGCTGSASTIQVVDRDGTPTVGVHNPGSESCAPCDRAALISPDGELLAHAERQWTRPLPSSCEATDAEAWKAEQLAETRLEVEVIHLGSGRLVWTIPDAGDVQLTDFDGRYLVVEDRAPWDSRVSTVYDTTDEHDPTAVQGRVVLMRSPPLTLQTDGLGVASFGDPVGLVMVRLTALFGPPNHDDVIDPVPSDVGLPGGFAANDYFRSSRWQQIGLSVVFSDAGRYRDDGIPHFVAWYSSGPELATDSGLRAGDTVGDLVAHYGGAVTLPVEPDDECNVGYLFWIGSALARLETINGGLSGDPNDPATRIEYLHGGAHSSC